ncbi:Rossmann-fold NAD(P)-binding domain-containing protein [Nonlabens ponticola]|uniref:Sugar metabolism enzyme n=1 Tax=Nonlabens ponticola TaxID=2496866 RepID=A0A3S9MW69_9FLAO|nr:sugar metabolism enzyme [Nonlabens ponticola]AZQ43379.1 sugar metabolism enzyme [Nonlabens ponticola]
MSNKTIGILGCGWLGTPLATALIEKGHRVKGSTTRLEKLQELRDLGIDPYMVELKETTIDGGIDEFLQDLDALIVNIPPGLRSNPESDYAGRLQLLVRNINLFEQIKRLIFISTTSVFEDMVHLPLYNENSTPNASSPKDRKIIAGEQVILMAFANTTIIRAGGLIGDERHPIKYLAGKKDLENPQAPVNLTEQSILIEKVLLLLELNKKLDYYHVITVDHLPREEYYTTVAIERGLDLPHFADEIGVGKKVVSLYSDNYCR